MSGIAGLFVINSNDAGVSIIREMSRILRHRGSDDEGCIAVNMREGEVTPLGGADSSLPLPDAASFDGRADLLLAHRRLAVTDLSSASHQPMSYADGNYWVTFDGELYNYMEIRDYLEKCGHAFRTSTDTEVMLAAYAEWGEECLDRFDGMWSFVLYDRRRNLLFGSRDRFGVKPLYYVKNGDYFAFASEAKAFSALPGFRRAARPEAVFDYLAFGLERWEDGRTFLEEVMELLPAHSFCFDLSERTLRVKRYYKLPFHDGAVWEPFCEKRAAEHVERVRELVFASVRRRLMSDVPVGNCLSGGIDSSSIFAAVGAILRDESIPEAGDRPRAFTACYKDASIDESAWARLAVEHSGGEWHTVYPQGDELMVDLEDLVHAQDFPFGGTSYYAHYRVMKLARDRGVRVLLHGQGGDELFTGYTPYYIVLFREMLGRSAWRDLVREWRGLSNAPMGKTSVLKGLLTGFVKQRLSLGLKRLRYRLQNDMLKMISPALADRHLDTNLERLSERLPRSLNEMLSLMMASTSLPEQLGYEDINSARFQVESRTPFAADRRLIEYVFSVPPVYKIHNGYSKWLLREAMKPYLPESIYRRKDKIGFATPENTWLRQNSDSFRSLITDEMSCFVDVPRINRKWSALIGRQPEGGAFPLWRLLNLAMWMKGL